MEGDQQYLDLYIDEGLLHRTIVRGVDAVQAVLLQMDVFLPDDIYHRPTLDRIMTRIIKRYRLANAYYQVRETQPLIPGPTGQLVKQRALNVYIIGRESFGWGIGLELNPVWGFVPWFLYRHRSLLLPDDRFLVKVGVGLPIRQYLFEEDPQFRWVHGFLDTMYRFPPVLGRFVRPFVDLITEYSRFSRLDIGLEEYLRLRVQGIANAELRFDTSFSVDIGTGVEHFNITDTRATSDAEREFKPRAITSGVLRTVARYTSVRDMVRQDFRKFVELGVKFSYATSDLWLIESDIDGQWVENWGFHDLILRTRGFVLGGVVNYWNRRPLSNYMRVFFDNIYWVDKAIVLDAAFRFSVNREFIKVGVFHDFAVFQNELLPSEPANLANAFGPSLHFLFFDTLALDLYYGFGFSPDGFDHTFVVAANKIF